MITNPSSQDLKAILLREKMPPYYTYKQWVNAIEHISNSYYSSGDDTFEIQGRIFSGDSVKILYGYLYSKPSEKLITWLIDCGHELTKSQKKNELKEHDLFELDVKSNELIKKYRSKLGLETPNNRIDTGDLKMIVLALYNMGFEIVKK
jgi:hypothetical protein